MRINIAGGGTAQKAMNASRQAGGSAAKTQADPVSKGIQRQIENAQKRLQELSSNKDLSPEEKMKRRQEIQQEITALNQQLRQHEMEQRKEQQAKNTEKQEEKKNSRSPAGAKQGDGAGKGMSQASMEAMISADVSMKQAQVQSSVAVKMEGRAGVLKSEIKQDQNTGVSTEAKEAELADAEQKAMEATAAQMDTLGKADRAIKEAAEEDSDSNRTGRTEGQQGKTAAGAVRHAEARQDADEGTAAPEASETDNTDTDAGTAPQPVRYRHVDVRL